METDNVIVGPRSGKTFAMMKEAVKNGNELMICGKCGEQLNIKNFGTHKCEKKD